MTSTLQPPIARPIPHETTMHGERRVDPYFWLRDRSNPEVIAYLNAENAYLQQMLQHTQPLQDQLYAEIRGRIKETDVSAPVKHDDYFYYSRMAEGRQYAIHCRRRGGLDADEPMPVPTADCVVAWYHASELMYELRDTIRFENADAL
jgi:oligopeptidase B